MMKLEEKREFDFLMSLRSVNSGNFYSFAKIQTAGITNIGLNKINVTKDQSAYQLLVRPDIEEDSLINLTEQILLAVGGVLKKFSHSTESQQETAQISTSSASVPTSNSNYSHMLECVSGGQDQNQSFSCWSVIRIYLGVNAEMERVLFLHITPATGAGAIASMLLSGIRKYPFHEFSESLLSSLCQALDSERLSLNHLMITSLEVESGQESTDIVTSSDSLLDMSQGSDDATAPFKKHSLPVSRDQYYQSPLQPLESIIDVNVVRDMQAMEAQLLLQRLHAQSDELDREVRVAEQQCARLMSLLRPSYARAAIALPVAPAAKLLSNYSLFLSRSSILEPSDADAKLTLLKARRRLREEVQCGARLSLEAEINSLLALVVAALREWSEEEFQARLQRKQSCVRDRLQSVHHFKMQLLITLHERFKAKSSLISSADQTLQTTVQDKFKFITPDEPVLLECGGSVWNSRQGTAYVTVGHLLFYSMGFLLSSVLAVIPLHTIATLSLVTGSKLVSSVSYQPVVSSSSNSGLLQPNSAGILPALIDCIVVMDTGRQETVVELKGLTPDHNQRVADLLDLLVREKLYVLRPAVPAPTAAAANHNLPGGPSLSSGMDSLLHLGDVSHLLSETSSASAASQGQSAQPVASAAPFAGTATAKVTEQPQQFVAESKSAPPLPSSAEPSEKPVAQVPKQRSSNIKKFLQKSHTSSSSSSAAPSPTNKQEIVNNTVNNTVNNSPAPPTPELAVEIVGSASTRSLSNQTMDSAVIDSAPNSSNGDKSSNESHSVDQVAPSSVPGEADGRFEAELAAELPFLFLDSLSPPRSHSGQRSDDIHHSTVDNLLDFLD